MIIPEIIINGIRLDTFEDASITLTDKLKEAQDIATIFTPYTQQFVVPASNTNNKLFEHYYSFHVLNGFDARRKHSALIKLNGADYKFGYIKLQSVELKNEVPDRYRIQFFGELTSLRDKFGDDMLEDIPGINKYNHNYDLTTVKSGFEKSLVYDGSGMVEASDTATNGEIIYPFISHTRGFAFSTTDGLYDVTVDPASIVNADKLDHSDLKPAIKVKTLIDEIGAHYDIDFSGQLMEADFAGTTPLEELYMWMHRDKGNLRSGGDEIDNANFFGVLSDTALGNPDELSLDSGDEQRVLGVYVGPFGAISQKYDVDFNVTTGDSGSFTMFAYGLNIDTNEITFYGQQVVSDGDGTLSFTVEQEWSVGYTTYRYLYFSVQAENSITSITPTITVDKLVNDVSTGTPGVYGGNSTSIVKQVLMNQTIPKMKVIDFITGIFRMFNVAGYGRSINNLSDAQTVVLDHYQDYMERGRLVDITRYVDPTSSTVERVNPYGYLSFKFPEPKTFLAKKHNEIFRDNFGSEELDTIDLTGGDSSYLFDGGKFEVSVPFEKMLYERLDDLDDSSKSSLQYGWFVNDFKENTPEPEIGQPLLFFRKNQSIDSGDDIDWSDGVTVTNTTYNRPSNVRADDSLTLHFGSEFDEWTAFDNDATPNENSLFKTYYETFLTALFSPDARLKKIKANLPPKFLLYYKLNDKLKIGNQVYQISSITTNLKTGEASLELIRLTIREELYVIETGDCYAFEYVVEPYWCTEPITLTS